MIKESLRISLQSWIAWDRNNWDCRKHSWTTSKFSQFLPKFLLLYIFLLSEKTKIWQKCTVTLCYNMSMVSLDVSVWPQILPNVNNIVIKELSHHFELLLVSVKLLTIKCFQERSSLIIYNISHMDICLLCWVLIHSNIRKNIFLCCPPGAVFIRVVVSLFSYILLAIFLQIPAVHCQHYKAHISYFRKWLSSWCKRS